MEDGYLSDCSPFCAMLTIAYGLFAFGLMSSAHAAAAVGRCSGNSTCSDGCQGGNGTCPEVSTVCSGNGTCAESRQAPFSCSSGNNCTTPADGTSRLLPSVTVASNGTSEKPLSTTTNFSPSPFLGVIPERPGSLVIGEVFQDSVGPRHKTFSFPNSPVEEYAHPRESYRDFRGKQFDASPPSVEIHVGGTDYDRPEYDNAGRPYGRPDVDITVPTGYGRPEGDVKPTFPKPENKPFTGTSSSDYNNHIDFSGYPDGRPKQPYYEGYENVKNLLKPFKNVPPYEFEPSFGAEKPIHEDSVEPHQYSLAYPPAGMGGPPAYHIPDQGKDTGSSKWKSALRFVATLLPFGLLLAALSPNILVISPVDDSDTAAKNPPGSHRSLQHGALGECGLRRLCEALSTSPQDYEIFLRAAKQGSTPELKDIIKKAEEKKCSSLGCLELKPTESTIR